MLTSYWAERDPARGYSFPFGPAFTTDDGYPNQRLDLRFHTKGAAAPVRQ